MKRALILLILIGAAVAGAAAVQFRRAGPPSGAHGFTSEELERIFQHSPLGEPPRDPGNAVGDSPEAAQLGQRLFFDGRLSRGGTVSCATCHEPSKGFGDGEALSPRFALDRNIPTLWNAAYHRWYFWDGRADSLWSQALKPIENPLEMASTRLQAVHAVLGDPVLRESYRRTFGEAPDLSDATRFPATGAPGHPSWSAMREGDRATVDRAFANLGKALAAYERRLLSRRSAFDVFVEGLKSGDAAKLAALSPSAREGLKLFVGKANCRLCHGGPAFSDGEFHNIGVPPSKGPPTPDRFAAIAEVRKDPFNTKGAFSDDPAAGREKLDYLIQSQDHWGQVKTPGLRNVARTAPYMHQGQFRTLKDAVEYYSTLTGMVQAGHHERVILLPLRLTDAEIGSLVAFLESLTDEQVDGRLLKPLP